MNRRPFSSAILSLLGAVAALAIFESALRPFATGWRERPYTRPAQVRQYYEGLATSNFGPHAGRLTGNVPLPQAANVVLLGDSHIEAFQVPDRQTVGSVLERLARDAGHPLNVHQYGWSSAAAPAYALAAPALLERWRPVRVVVVLNSGDIYQAFGGPERLVLTGDVPKIIQEAPPPPAPWQQKAAPLLRNSVVIYHAYRSARMMQEAARLEGGDFPIEAEVALDPPPEQAASATVKLLKHAYGDHLVIVYDRFLWGLHTGAADDGRLERAMLNTCRSETVTCLTTYDKLVEDRHARQRLSRGFSNTAPGEGHWNQVGHELLARVIWHGIQPAKDGR